MNLSLRIALFFLPPVVMLLTILLASIARRRQRTRAPSSRYRHALDQQELDALLHNLDHARPRRGFSVHSCRH